MSSPLTALELAAAATASVPGGMYTVICRGVERFVLSRSQISFDSPNHFTDAFLGEFAEATTRAMYLDIHPKLFEIIVDYLSGEDVLPLQREALPRTMCMEKATHSLARHADYLDLNGLATLLKQRTTLAVPNICMSIARYSTKIVVDLDDLLANNPPVDVRWPSQRHRPLVDDDGKYVFVRAKAINIEFVCIYHLSRLLMRLTSLRYPGSLVA
jgi:hypothetical protein